MRPSCDRHSLQEQYSLLTTADIVSLHRHRSRWMLSALERQRKIQDLRNRETSAETGLLYIYKEKSESEIVAQHSTNSLTEKSELDESLWNRKRKTHLVNSATSTTRQFHRSAHSRDPRAAALLSSISGEQHDAACIHNSTSLRIVLHRMHTLFS